jgi:hypothetical protein
MSVAMTFGGALIRGPRNATTTISVQSRSFERHLCTFCKGFRLQICQNLYPVLLTLIESCERRLKEFFSVIGGQVTNTLEDWLL